MEHGKVKVQVVGGPGRSQRWPSAVQRPCAPYATFCRLLSSLLGLSCILVSTSST
jgi:hypothetical protein